MQNKKPLKNLFDIIQDLKKEKIIAYPTESVFGLGCDPDSKKAVKKLLKLKKRSWRKGFILVASSYNQVTKYIDQTLIKEEIKRKIFSSWPGPITWLLPAKKNTPYWITGNHKSIAIRISSFKIIRKICFYFGKAIISTSANINIQKPARTMKEVKKNLGNNINILYGKVEGKNKPSKIIDAVSNKIIRIG